MTDLKKGIYRHYKGAKYRVVGEASNSETKEGLVIYQDLKDKKKVWARPKQMFLDKVETPDGPQARFAFVEEELEGNQIKPSGENGEGETDSWEKKYLRALADYQNLMKQAARERQEFVKYAVGEFLQDLLPVYDHLKLSLFGLNVAESESPWVIGVRHVLKQFKEVLNDKGVEEIKTVGEKFNHDTMEAVSGEGEIVIQETSPGYKLNGRVIRPAKVIVGVNFKK